MSPLLFEKHRIVPQNLIILLLMHHLVVPPTFLSGSTPLAPSKSCGLDPLPTTFMEDFLPELLPYLTDLCNSSLMEGYLPVSQRHSATAEESWR